MSGVKQRSGGPRKHKGNTGGERKNAGRKPDGLKKIQPSVILDTIHTLTIFAAKQGIKGKAVKPTIFAASILDLWASQENQEDQEQYRKKLPAPYSVRRAQVTVRVKKETALKIYQKSLAENTTTSFVSGEILDLWSIRNFDLSVLVFDGKIKTTKSQKEPNLESDGLPVQDTGIQTENSNAAA